MCPPPIPDRKGKKFTFFESILVGFNKLHENLTTEKFLNERLYWAGRSFNKSEWYLQNVLNAYYLVGLIPFTQFVKYRDQYLAATLAESNDLQEIRRYCLTCVTERLDKMHKLWLLASSLELFDKHKVSESLEITFEDAKRRIRILRNLSALQRKGIEYQLTPWGIEFVSSLELTIDYEAVPQVNLVNETVMKVDSFGDFVEW